MGFGGGAVGEVSVGYSVSWDGMWRLGWESIDAPYTLAVWCFGVEVVLHVFLRQLAKGS